MKTILTITTALVLSLSPKCQEAAEFQPFYHPLKLKFIMLDDKGEPLKGCQIITFKNNEKCKTSHVKGNRYNVKCEESDLYTLEVSHPDFLTKRIAINAFHANKPLYNDVFKFYVGLEPKGTYTQSPETEDYLDYPIAILVYDEESAEFTYSKEYIRSSRKSKQELISQVSLTTNP